MAFELYTGAHRRESKNSNHARFKIKKDGSGILSFSTPGVDLIKDMKLSYNIGDSVELHIDKDSNAIAFKKSNSDFSVNLSRYGRVGSTRFQIYSKSLASDGLVTEGEYTIEEPKKSEFEFDFILYLVKP